MVKGFANLSDELQLLVVEKLLFSEVMELCQTSKTIRRQDRCRHLLRHWLRKHIPDAFTPASPYIDGESPTKWIKIYSEAQVGFVTTLFQNVLDRLRVGNHLPIAQYVTSVNNLVHKKFHLERLPIRATTSYPLLLRSMNGIRQFLDNDNEMIGSQVQRTQRGLLVTVFLIVCGHSQTLRDIMSYSNEKWRALVLRYRYQNVADIQFAWAPIIPPTFLVSILRAAPYDAEEVSRDLTIGEYAFLLRHGLITVSWDSIIAQLARANRSGEGGLLDALRNNLIQKLPHSTVKDIAHQATLEEGLIRSQPWPALQKMLLGVFDLNKAETGKENGFRQQNNLVGLHPRVKFMRAYTKVLFKKFGLAQTVANRLLTMSAIVTATVSFVDPGGDRDPQTAFEEHALKTLSTISANPSATVGAPSFRPPATVGPLRTFRPPATPTHTTARRHPYSPLASISDIQLSLLTDDYVRSLSQEQLSELEEKVVSTLERVTKDADARRRSASKIPGLERIRDLARQLINAKKASPPS